MHVRCSIKTVINRRFPTGRSSVDGRGDCHDYSPDIRLTQAHNSSYFPSCEADRTGQSVFMRPFSPRPLCNNRGVRYRGVIPEARTKKQAEQAESKIKQEILKAVLVWLIPAL